MRLSQQFKIGVLLLAIIFASTAGAQKHKGQKGNSNGGQFDPDNFKDRGYSDLNELINEHPEKLVEINTQYDIKSNEGMLEGVILAHVRDYQNIYEKENKKRRFLQKKKNNNNNNKSGDYEKNIKKQINESETQIEEELEKDLESKFLVESSQKAKEYLDKLIKAIFDIEKKRSSIRNFETAAQSQSVKKQNGNNLMLLNTLITKTKIEQEKFIRYIMDLFKQEVDSKDDNEYLVQLNDAVDRVINYYVETRKFDTEELTRIFKKTGGLDQSASWAENYLSDPKFQSVLDKMFDDADDGNMEEVLNGILENDDLFNQLFGDDFENWDEVTEQIHQQAIDNSLDMNQVDYLLEQAQKQKEMREREKRLKEQEELNKKSDSTVLIILGLSVIGIVGFCFLRYMRKKKIERDQSYSRNSQGYHGGQI